MDTLKREDRYFVVKKSDLNSTEQRLFQDFLNQYLVLSRECVVVESDWPEYGPTWKAIEDRVNEIPGKQETAVSAFNEWYAKNPYDELSTATAAMMAFKQGVAYALNLGSYKP